MLEELHVHNYAIIDKLQVRFTSGLNILSGETGAGKSILVGALGLLLGDKTDTSIIRSGAEETTVSGIVSVPGNAEAAQWLAAHGIEAEEGAVILRRMLKSNGRGSLRSRARISTSSPLFSSTFTASMSTNPCWTWKTTASSWTAGREPNILPSASTRCTRLWPPCGSAFPSS